MNKIIDDSNQNLPRTGAGKNNIYNRAFKEEPAETPAPVQTPQSPVIPSDKPIDGNTQITLTFDQLMQLLSKSDSALSQSTDQDHAQVSPAQPEETGEAGTRVIYQSEDFEREEKKKSFVSYDDDSFLDDEQVSKTTLNNIRNNHAPITYTPVRGRNGKFAVSEIEIDSASLPGLNESRLNQARPAISSGRGNLPVIAVSGNVQRHRMGNVEIEEREYSEPVNNEKQENDFDFEAEPQKKGGDKVRKIILAIAIIAIVASGAYLVREYSLHRANKQYEEEISNMIIDVPTTEETTTTKSSKKDKNKNKEKEKTTSEAEKSIEQQWEEVKTQYPNVDFPAGMQLKYAKLYATNKDFVGYLEAPGTKLSLPVVQTEESDEINSYLKKNFYGSNTKYGCPFVSSFNTLDDSDMDYNTVIFGHHMNDNTIFGALDVYKNINGFKNAPIINFNTLNKDYKWKIIASFITNDDPVDDNGYKFEYSHINLLNDTYKQTFLNELAKRSLYDTGVDVTVNDKLLTLSTCSHEFDNARFVVVARMVRAGESAEVDVTKAFENASPRFPQAYYTAKKMENPYVEDNNWYGE